MPLNGQLIPYAFFSRHPVYCAGELGGVDTSFGTNGYLQVDYNSTDNLNQWTPNVFDTDSQGRIYLSGWDSSGAYNIPVIARVNPSGTIDTTFGTSGFVTHDLGVGANGKSIQIYNDEIFVSLNGSIGDAIMKTDINGSLVGAFGTSGVATNPNATTGDGLYIGPNGDMFQTGQAPGANSDISATKFNRTTGALETGFASSGYLLTNLSGDEFGYNTYFVGTGDEFYLTSERWSSGWKNSVTKWNTVTGAAVTSFANNGHLQFDASGTRARWLNTDPSGNIYVQASTGNSVYVTKADPSGNIDTTWGTSGTATFTIGDSGAGVRGMAFIEDNIFVFVSVVSSSITQLGIAKLQTNGSLDTGFGTSGIQLHEWPGSINAQPLTFKIDNYNRVLFGYDLTSPSDGDWGLARFCLDLDSNKEAMGLSVGDVVVNEGNNIVFEIRGSREADQNLTIDYTTSDGTGIAGTHYTATSGTATILSGQRSAFVSVPINDLATCDGTRTFNFTISNNSAGTITDMQAQGTILDTDAPTITMNDGADVVEGNNAVATATTSIACSIDLTFDVTTSDGTAGAGQDYTAQTNQTYTVLAGNTSVNIPIVTLDDILDEVRIKRSCSYVTIHP